MTTRDDRTAGTGLDAQTVVDDLEESVCTTLTDDPLALPWWWMLAFSVAFGA